jgi:hypothetical protein
MTRVNMSHADGVGDEHRGRLRRSMGKRRGFTGSSRSCENAAWSGGAVRRKRFCEEYLITGLS